MIAQDHTIFYADARRIQ